MNLVQDAITLYLPSKQKVTPSGWTSFNAPCCHHNGTSADTRQRGGIIKGADGEISYHCFNCGFKTGWQPGRNISYKLRQLLQWLNVPDDVINKLALEVMKVIRSPMILFMPLIFIIYVVAPADSMKNFICV